jgi:hypothetical protein
MSETRVPEEAPIRTDKPEVPEPEESQDDDYEGPDPEADPKGDGADEDQGPKPQEKLSSVSPGARRARCQHEGLRLTRISSSAASSVEAPGRSSA